MSDHAIDYRAAEVFLDARRTPFIQRGATLDREFFQWCASSNFGAVEILALFPSSGVKKKEQLPYVCELICPACRVWFTKPFPKSLIREIIILYKRGRLRRPTDEYDFQCPACEAKREAEDAAWRADPHAHERSLEAWRQRERDEATARTPAFIKFYLVPGARWNTDIPREDLYLRLRANRLDDDMVAEAIRRMPEDTFYDTPYWAAVAAEVFTRTKGRCSVCPATEDLHLLYRTMDHHGYEHTERGLGEILCLCGACQRTYVFQRRVGPLTGLN